MNQHEDDPLILRSQEAGADAHPSRSDTRKLVLLPPREASAASSFKTPGPPAPLGPPTTRVLMHSHPPHGRHSARSGRFGTAAIVTVASLLFAGGYTALSSSQSAAGSSTFAAQTDDQVVADPDAADASDPAVDPDAADVDGDVLGEDPDVPEPADADAFSIQVRRCHRLPKRSSLNVRRRMSLSDTSI